MKLFRSCAAVLALTAASLALTANAQEVQQNASGDPLYTCLLYTSDAADE